MNVQRSKIARALTALLVAPLAALVLLPQPPAQAAEADGSGEAIVLFHSNDVHCSGIATSDKAIGYAGIAQAVADARADVGIGNVTLIDAGDAIQGQPIGLLSEGGDLVDMMNAAGYDIAVPGNHEFDYGIPRLQALADDAAEYPYVACNIVNTETGKALFEPYQMLDYTVDGQTVTVAYVGITTPTTLTSESPSIFQNAAGKTVWSFYGENDGQALYSQVQSTVDAAHAAGADYVIAVAHLGKDASSSVPEGYTSTAVIANTTGIDGVIDGHTHLIYNVKVANKDGELVPLAQCGTQFQAYGTMTITPDGDPGPEDVASAVTVAANQAAPVAQDEAVAEVVAAKEAALADKLAAQVGTTEAGLSVYAPNDEGNPWWWVARMRESNLGDFVADAYRAYLDADVALVNGGGIRAPQTAITPLSDGTFGFGAGPLTYADFMSINSFGNPVSLVRVSGQDLLDALEYSVRTLTPALDDETEATGSFLQVSGLKFTAAVDIPTPVVENADGGFDCIVPGLTRRVRDVTVGGEPLDPAKSYTLASIPIILSGSGDYTMFGDAEPVISDAGTDYQILVEYVTRELGGTISRAQYGNPGGDGRIEILTSGSRPSSEMAVYRLYNPYMDGAHLYTVDVNEVQTLVGLGWQNEGPQFAEYGAPTAQSTPIFRLYNENNGDHLYTISHPEVEALVALNTGWTYEDICWYAPIHPGLDVYRLYNPYQVANAGLGNHLWTVSVAERDRLVALGWQDEGLAWYALS